MRIVTLLAVLFSSLFMGGAATAQEFVVKDGVSLNIRSGPGTTYPVRERAKPGSILRQVTRSGSWIETERGWVHSDFLEPVSSPASERAAILFNGSGKISRPVKQAALSPDGRILATLHIPTPREIGFPYVQLWDVKASRQLYAIPFKLPVSKSEIPALLDYSMSFRDQIEINVWNWDWDWTTRIVLDIPSAKATASDVQPRNRNEICSYPDGHYEISYHSVYLSFPGVDPEEWLWDKESVKNFYEFKCLKEPTDDRFLAIITSSENTSADSGVVFLDSHGNVSAKVELPDRKYQVVNISNEKGLVVLTDHDRTFIELRRIDTGEEVFSAKVWGQNIAVSNEFAVFSSGAKVISSINLKNLQRTVIDLSAAAPRTGSVGSQQLLPISDNKVLISFSDTVALADLKTNTLTMFVDEKGRNSREIDDARWTGNSSGLLSVERRNNYSYLDVRRATIANLSDKLTVRSEYEHGVLLPEAVLFSEQDGKHVYLIGDSSSRTSFARHQFIVGARPPPNWRNTRSLDKFGDKQVYEGFWEAGSGRILSDVEISSDLFISRKGTFAFFDQQGRLRLWGEHPEPGAPLAGYTSIFSGTGLPTQMIGDSIGEFILLKNRGKPGFFHVDRGQFVELRPQVVKLMFSGQAFGRNYRFLPSGLLVTMANSDTDFVDRVFLVDPETGDLVGTPVKLQFGFGTMRDVLNDDELLIDSSVVDLRTGKTRMEFANPSGIVHSAVAGPATSSGQYVFLVTDGGIDIYDAAKPERLATVNMSGANSWIITTPAGFYTAGGGGDRHLRVAYGLDTVLSIDKFRDALYRPDLVAETLKGDPEGLVKTAAAKVSLEKILQSGAAPEIVIKGEQSGGTVKASAEIRDAGGGIGRLEWRVNGVVQARAEGKSTDAAELFLAGGDNSIELISYNKDNTIQGRSDALSFTLDEAQASPPRLFVLAVGVDKYKLDALQLKYAGGDAEAIAAAFEKAGAGLYGEIFVEVLKDGDVTRGGLETKFKDLARSVRPNDVFVFFSAGHGKTLDGRFFFVPQDFSGTTVASIREQGIGHATWQEWFSLVPAQKSLLLFDSCESGSLTDTVTGRELRFRAANDFLGNATGRALLAASSGTGVALEGYKGHGVFAWSVIDALSHADRDANGLIDIDELTSNIEVTVPKIAEEAFGEKQTPQFKAPMKGFDVVRPIGRTDGP